MIIKVLKLVGLYKVKTDYLKNINKDLDSINTNIESITKKINNSFEIIYALNIKNFNLAIEVLSKFDGIKTTDNLLKKIFNSKNRKNEINSENKAKLLITIAALIKQEIQKSEHEVESSIASIKSIINDFKDKKNNFKKVTQDWSRSEKIGTADATRICLTKFEKLYKNARKSQTEINRLLDSIKKISPVDTYNTSQSGYKKTNTWNSKQEHSNTSDDTTFDIQSIFSTWLTEINLSNNEKAKNDLSKLQKEIEVNFKIHIDKKTSHSTNQENDNSSNNSKTTKDNSNSKKLNSEIMGQIEWYQITIKSNKKSEVEFTNKTRKLNIEFNKYKRMSKNE